MGSNLVSGSRMAIPDALVTAVLGYATVFAGIILLILVVVIIGKLMTSGQKKVEAVKPSLMKEPVSDDSDIVQKAPGSAGELKLYDTDPRTAAMIMAIVADNLGKPLNELRFKSIREVKEDEI